MLHSPRSQGGLSKEWVSKRMAQWSLKWEGWLVSLSTEAALSREGLILPSPLRHDGNPTFQKGSWEIRTQSKDNWRFLTKRIRRLRGKRSKRLKLKRLSEPLDGLNLLLSCWVSWPLSLNSFYVGISTRNWGDLESVGGKSDRRTKNYDSVG